MRTVTWYRIGLVFLVGWAVFTIGLLFSLYREPPLWGDVFSQHTGTRSTKRCGGSHQDPPYTHLLCIISHCEETHHGSRIFSYFPSTPAIWNVSSIKFAIRLFRDADTGNFDCAYFFFLDRDVKFQLNSREQLRKAWEETTSVEGHTHYLLAKYKPAVLAFMGSENPIRSILSQREVISTTADLAVGQAIVFHSSIVEFLLGSADGDVVRGGPLPPLLLKFLPYMYQGSFLLSPQVSIVHRSLLLATNTFPSGSPPNGSVHELWPRIKEGMKDFRSSKFGPHAELEHIEWTMKDPAEEIRPGYYTNFLPRINTFFDLMHPAVVEAPWVSEQYHRDQLLIQRQKLSYPRLQIIVFTCDRLDALKRLIKSLLVTDYSQIIHYSLDLTIEVDFSPMQSRVRRFLDSVTWAHGRLTVRYSPIHRGLDASILSSWYPTHLDEMALLLEDNVQLSPVFPQWLLRAAKQYYYGFNGLLRDNPLVGIALSSPPCRQGSQEKTEATAFMMQYVCSGAALYTPYVWREFLDWYERYSGYEPVVPDLNMHGICPTSHSWTKFLLRFMVETGSFMIYPNMAVSINRDQSIQIDQTRVKAVLTPQPLINPINERDLTVSLPTALEMRKYDVYGRIMTSLSPFSRFLQPDWHAMGQFTVLISSRSRNVTELGEAIHYWQTIHLVREIVVRWFEEESSVKALHDCPTSGEHIQVRCRVENVGRSPQKRFLPLSNATTLIVLSLDADVRISLADVEVGFYTIQTQPVELVGFEQCTVSLGHGSSDPDKFRVALTTVAFFHISYLSSYWTLVSLEEARAMVDQKGAGEDLLMNLVISLSRQYSNTRAYLMPGNVHYRQLSTIELQKRDSLLRKLAEQFHSWPVAVKLFPTPSAQLPRPLRVPSLVSSDDSTPPLSLALEGKLTVIFTSFQTNLRSIWVRKSITTFLSDSYVDIVDRVILVWNDPEQPCPISIHHPNFIVLHQKVNSLNARWTHTIPYIRTSAVLNLDDDVFLDRSAIKCMLGWWEHDPQRMVAPFVRRIFPNSTYVMDNLMSGGAYSIALPRAIIVAKSELQRYADSSVMLRRYVDEQEAHCDDILLNAVSINYTNKVPLRVQLPPSSLIDYTATCYRGYSTQIGGLAMQANRTQKRSQCTKYLSEAFPRWGNPLFKITDLVAQCTPDGNVLPVMEKPELTPFAIMFGRAACAEGGRRTRLQ